MKPSGKSPSGRCTKHGGRSLRGSEVKGFTTGKTSKLYAAIPDEYRETFLAYLADPNLLDNTNQIALLAARWQEQTTTLSSGENKFSIQALQELWAELQSTNKSLARARESGDEEGIKKAQQQFTSTMAAIGKMIGAAADKFQAWEDWKETTKDLSALRIDQARMKDFQARYMAAEMVVAIGIALRDAVMSVLNPREHAAELRKIVEELDRVMGNGVMLGRVVGQVQETDGE